MTLLFESATANVPIGKATPEIASSVMLFQFWPYPLMLLR